MMAMSPLNTAASGVTAGLSALSNSAHSIANTSTRGFQPAQANFSESAPAGTGVSISFQGQQLASGDLPSATDLTSEITNSLVYKAQTQASLSVLKTTDETLGSLINIKA
jgi:flagellar hook protein FlgE